MKISSSLVRNPLETISRLRRKIITTYFPFPNLVTNVHETRNETNLNIKKQKNLQNLAKHKNFKPNAISLTNSHSQIQKNNYTLSISNASPNTHQPKPKTQIFIHSNEIRKTSNYTSRTHSQTSPNAPKRKIKVSTTRRSTIHDPVTKKISSLSFVSISPGTDRSVFRARGDDSRTAPSNQSARGFHLSLHRRGSIAAESRRRFCLGLKGPFIRANTSPRSPCTPDSTCKHRRSHRFPDFLLLRSTTDFFRPIARCSLPPFLPPADNRV